MGTDVLVLVAGPRAEARAERAVTRIAELEARWSRFRSDSELSRLVAAAGVPLPLSAETFLLVERAVAAWHATSGRFDPTVLPAMLANGYDRSLERLGESADLAAEPSVPSPGCAGIELDAAACTVRLPSGVALDPGGIGKGLAADLVVTELRNDGAPGVLVDIGGDVRVWGSTGDGEPWTVSVEDPFDGDREITRFGLHDGAVATSSRLKRRWQRAGVTMHHLVDPRTGRPLDTPFVSVTVLAGEAWWAEALTKAVFVAGDTSVLQHASVIAVDENGGRHVSADLTLPDGPEVVPA